MSSAAIKSDIGWIGWAVVALSFIVLAVSINLDDAKKRIANIEKTIATEPSP